MILLMTIFISVFLIVLSVVGFLWLRDLYFVSRLLGQWQSVTNKGRGTELKAAGSVTITVLLDWLHGSCGFMVDSGEDIGRLLENRIEAGDRADVANDIVTVNLTLAERSAEQAGPDHIEERRCVKLRAILLRAGRLGFRHRTRVYRCFVKFSGLGNGVRVVLRRFGHRRFVRISHVIAHPSSHLHGLARPFQA